MKEMKEFVCELMEVKGFVRDWSRRDDLGHVGTCS